MCEPFVTAKTGKSVEEHQRLTVENFLELKSLAPDLPFAPVLQGWHPSTYTECAEMYQRAGVDLAAEPVVGVGSVCRRQSGNSLAYIASTLFNLELTNLHGFGLKKLGLKSVFGDVFRSADSLAWSFSERKNRTGLQNDFATALERGYIAGLFFERTGGKHETSSPDTWGPKYPVHVDWRHFPTYTISFDDEEGTRVEVWGDNLIELRERLRDVDYKGSSIVVRNDAGEFVGTVTATSYRYT
jgi:hypothetical protein